MDTSYRDRRLAEKMKDPGYRAAYEEAAMAIRFSDYVPPSEPSVVVGGRLVPEDEDSLRALASRAMSLTFPWKLDFDGVGPLYQDGQTSRCPAPVESLLDEDDFAIIREEQES